MSSVTPDGEKVTKRRHERGFPSRGALASHIDELCTLWEHSGEEVSERQKPLISFIRQLQTEGRARPEVVSESAIRDVERGNDCRPDTLLAIAYGLGLSSYELLLKRDSPRIALDRDVTGTWTGRGRELEFPEHNADFSVELIIRMTDQQSIEAPCVLKWGRTQIAFTMIGELCFGQIVKLDYTSVEQRDMRFGTLMLKLNGFGNELCGYALGYSAVLEKPTVAQVNLKRKRRRISSAQRQGRTGV
jgi:hypothetical protein